MTMSKFDNTNNRPRDNRSKLHFDIHGTGTEKEL